MSDNTNEVEETEVEVEETEVEVEETEVEVEKTGTKDDRVYTKADVDKAVKRRQEALKEARELKKELAQLKAQNETETERARREAAEEAQAAADKKYKPVLVKKHAEATLLEAGVKPNKINRLIKLMDLDEIEVDSEFNVEGVDEEVERLQEEFPELFGSPEAEAKAPEKKRPERRAAPPADGADKPAPKKPLTTAEKLLKQLGR